MSNEELLNFVEKVSGESHLRVEYDFGDGFVRLHTSEAERRQAAQDIQCSENILLELLRNSKDAASSHIFVASSKIESKRVISIIDDGSGIPAPMHKHIFEPRVTSKLNTSHKDSWGYHGRGMALYSIKANSEVAEVLSSAEDLGTAIQVISDTSKLSERSDQSSFPRFYMQDNNKVAIRGPKNLLRTACEFALDARNCCSIFFGSPAEIAATLFAYSEASLSTIERTFCQDINLIPLVKRLALASDPEDFCSQAKLLGLELSERTARRVMNGEIVPVLPILDQIEIDQEEQNISHNSISKKKQKKLAALTTNAIHLSIDERSQLSSKTKEAFQDIAESYYLDETVEPIIKCTNADIEIKIPIVRKDSY